MPLITTETFLEEYAQLEWWITSIPIYYCGHLPANPAADDFSTTRTFMGNGWTDFITDRPTTTGFKVGYSDPNEGATQITLADLSDWRKFDIVNHGGGNYGASSFQQSPWKVTNDLSPLTFGPYQASKTTEDVIVPNSILLVTSGSQVLQGNLVGPPNSEGDTRFYNLIFYSADGEGAQELISRITGQNVSSYDLIDRSKIIDAGYFPFVALSQQGSPENVKWWPGTWKDNSTNVFYALNAC
jgi:hypothetical protein